jgi:tape measure domain-containing protein
MAALAELIFQITPRAGDFKGTMAQVRSELSQTAKTQQAQQQTRVTGADRAAKEVQKIEAQTAREAEKQSKIQERAAKSLADEKIRQGRRAARDLERQLAEEVRARRAAAREAQSAGRSFALLAGATGGIAALIGVSAISEIRNAASAWVDYSSKLESTRIAFTTMLGSAQAAEQHLKALQQFALKTPFQFGELIDASQRMQALGFRAEQVIPILTDVGNAVAAAGGGSERLDRVTLALSQIQSKGKVMSQEFNQLAEAGISGWKILEAQLGKTQVELRKMVEQGEISADVFLAAFQKFSQQNFGGLMEAQSKTFAGAMSNIKDALLQTSATAFAPLYARLSETALALAKLSTESKEFQQNMTTAGNQIITVWDGVVEVFYVVRDVVGLVAAGAISIIGLWTHAIIALYEAVRALYLNLKAVAQIAAGDFFGGMESARRATEAARLATSEATDALRSQGAVAEQVVRIWENAEARKAAASISAAQKIAFARLGSTFLGPEIESSGDLALPAGLRPGTRGAGGVPRGARGGRGSVDKISAGQRLLNQLTDEYNKLRDKSNNLTKLQIVLLDEMYKAATPVERRLIQAKAREIESLEKVTAAEKVRMDALKSVTDFIARQNEAIRDAVLNDDEWDKQIRQLTVTLTQAGAKIDTATFSLLKNNDAILKMIALNREADTSLGELGSEFEGLHEKLAEFIDPTGSGTAYLEWLREISRAIKDADIQGHVEALRRAQGERIEAQVGPAPPPMELAGNDTRTEMQKLFDLANENLTGASQVAALAGLEALTEAFGGLGQAIGQVVEAWVLYGSAGTNIRKVTAQILAAIAQEAAVKAIFQLAEGFAALFIAPPKAAAHFKAAALYGAVAGVAAAAGRAVAGNAFNDKGGGTGTGQGGRESAPRRSGPEVIDVNRRSSSAFQPVVNVVIKGEATEGFRYMVERVAVESVRVNGPMRKIQKGEDV